jgi:hypothetical protein
MDLLFAYLALGLSAWSLYRVEKARRAYKQWEKRMEALDRAANEGANQSFNRTQGLG